MSTYATEPWRAFDRWCAEHDPDGDLAPLDAVMAYSKWASVNSIEPYLDGASPLPNGECDRG